MIGGQPRSEITTSLTNCKEEAKQTADPSGGLIESEERDDDRENQDGSVRVDLNNQSPNQRLNKEKRRRTEERSEVKKKIRRERGAGMGSISTWFFS